MDGHERRGASIGSCTGSGIASGMNVRGCCAIAVLAWLLTAASASAADLLGQVTFNGQPVPGATVTATRAGGQDGDPVKKVTASDPQGVYRFPDLAEGVWTITVQM